jgi:nucleoside-diphosphate-sugar epimerase
MRILITGAGSNVGRGMTSLWREAGHDLVLSDLNALPDQEAYRDLPFVACDIQTGVGLEKAAEGCDAILHLPAWHGTHWATKTEVDFWRLNVDGSFWMFQAARAAGVHKVIFLSSQSWHGHYDKYGFTKRVGEELCEYYRGNHDINYVAIRPHDFTPWKNFANDYGPRLLHGGVDREDVLDSIDLSLRWLASKSDVAGGYLDATRHDPFTAAQIAGWSDDPVGHLEEIFPGSRELVTRYGIDVSAVPEPQSPSGEGELSNLIGYKPGHHFGTFIEELRRLDAVLGRERVLALRCPYAAG